MQINAHWGKANSPIYTHWWILNYSVTFRIALNVSGQFCGMAAQHSVVLQKIN